MQSSTNNVNLQSICFKTLTLRCWHRQETKALEQKRKWRCFSTRQHNQFQVTFYINSRRSWLSARVQVMSACSAKMSVPAAETKVKKQGSFFSWKVSCGLRKSGEFVSGPDFDLDLPLSWQWINNRKRPGWEASKVRTQTGRSMELIVRLEDSVVT